MCIDQNSRRNQIQERLLVLECRILMALLTLLGSGEADIMISRITCIRTYTLHIHEVNGMIETNPMKQSELRNNCYEQIKVIV